MLAMSYFIRLDGLTAVAAVRRRIQERGPVFDGMPGLAHKWFLLDAADPTYGNFYLWHTPAAALGFLQGPLFRGLCDTFGRPEVKLLLPTAVDLPTSPQSAASIVNADLASPGAKRIAVLDPLDGKCSELVFRETASGQTFDVAYHAVGELAS